MLETLYLEAFKRGITVDNFFIENVKGMVVQLSPSNNHIILNQTLLENSREECIVLAEEIGHVEYDCLYHCKDILNPCQRMNIDKAELRAKKWAYTRLVPLEELKKASETYSETYQLAEYFDVTEEIIVNAITYYKQRNLL